MLAPVDRRAPVAPPGTWVANAGAMHVPNLPRPALLAALFLAPVAAQQPFLSLPIATFAHGQPSATFYYTMAGRQDDLYLLLADTSSGPTTLLGQSFDLGFTNDLFVLATGIFGPTGLFAALPIAPDQLPVSVLYLQFAEWDLTHGFGDPLVSNCASVVFHDFGVGDAVVFDFRYAQPWAPLTGDYDQSAGRLQALPPLRRTVRPLAATPNLVANYTDLQPLHPAGARCQQVVRAADLGADGHAEQLVAVRWRPLFGGVTAESFPQFELRAALTDVVPDYTIDPFSALPVAPTSGLSTTFTDNPRPGTTSVVYSGPYSVQPSALRPNGYLPFPAPQTPFVYDGTSSLLLETRVQPTPGLGSPQNHVSGHLNVLSSPEPYSLLTAIAGQQGQPSPLPPASATTGTGGSWQWDLELEFLRTDSVVTTSWTPSFGADLQPPQIAASVPPGTDLLIEYRGTTDPQFGTPTAWSTSQDVADGLPWLQLRITMHADPITGAAPWVQQVVVSWL